MAQLLLIKEVNTPYKAVDDIVGFYEDNYIFAPSTLLVCNVLKIEGYTREQLFNYAYGKLPEDRYVYRSKTIQWTLERPEKVDAWNDNMAISKRKTKI